MPLVAAALTFGSFGDILEAAKIAKHIVDVLRNGASDSEAQRRQKLISTLEGICDGMAKLTFLFDAGCFTDRLCTEVDLCCSLLDEFYAKINSYKAARGLLGRTWMVAVEEKELASWRAQISERRAALRDQLCSLNSIQLHEVSDQVGRVGSQVQYIGSRVDSINAQVQEVGTLGVFVIFFVPMMSSDETESYQLTFLPKSLSRGPRYEKQYPKYAKSAPESSSYSAPCRSVIFRIPSFSSWIRWADR